MIPRANRFRGLGSLRFVYKNGRSVRGSFISLKFVKNPQRRDFRCAVVVSKRIHKSAVMRNRLRRRIYEAVRNGSGQITETYDMVFTVSDEKLSSAPAASLQKEVGTLLKSAGITDKVKPSGDDMIEQQEK